MSIEERVQRLERLVGYLLGDEPYPEDLARPGRVVKPAKVIDEKETAEYVAKVAASDL